jgi:hypothetical protein
LHRVNVAVGVVLLVSKQIVQFRVDLFVVDFSLGLGKGSLCPVF